MEQFLSYIKRFVNVSKDLEQELISKAITKKVSKGETLLDSGGVCSDIFFIVEGTLRTYFFQNGKDITYWVYPKNYVFTSWQSYIQRKPSLEYIEATEPSEVIMIGKNHWEDLYEDYPELERFMRLLLEEQMSMLDTFYRGYYFMTAKEKYELLLEKYPDVTLRANLGHIASMLGISQETLSRIRSK